MLAMLKWLALGLELLGLSRAAERLWVRHSALKQGRKEQQRDDLIRDKESVQAAKAHGERVLTDPDFRKWVRDRATRR